MLPLRKLFNILVLMLLPFILPAQFYYGQYQNFGKNRVQYKDFDWTYFRYEQFDVYFYKQGKPIAEKASVMAQRHFMRMQKLLDQPIDQRLRIMVFNSLSDLKQSNLNASDDESFNTGGVTRTAGTRMFVYFNGDYAHLEGQIREGLAFLIIQNMLYGGFGSAIKNSTLLNMPEWFSEGLISYLSTPWNPEIDERVRDGFSSKTYKRINSLQGEEARYCGHSIWHYIAETYGEGVIKNLIFQTIMSRSVDYSLNQVLGIGLNEMMNNWKVYYATLYQPTLSGDNLKGKEIARSRKEERLFQPRISQSGRYMAYAGNEQGYYKVYVYDFVKKSKKVVLRKGFRIAQNNDYSYPLLAWNPNSRILAAITEEKGFIWLYFYDVTKKKLDKKPLYGFEKVLSFSYSNDGRELLMSAVKQGRSDIFVYTILSSSIEQITNDDFTDLYPAFIKSDQQIVFSSNRVDDSIRVNEKVWQFGNNHDLFVYHRFRKDNKVLWRLTKTPNESEVQAEEYEPGYVIFLSNPAGIKERGLIGIDSSIAFVDTITHYNYHFNRYATEEITRNVADEDFSPEGERGVSLYFINRRYRIYETPFVPADQAKLTGADNRIRENATIRSRKKAFSDIEISDNRKGKDIAFFEVNIDDYEFDPTAVAIYAPSTTKTKVPVVPDKKTDPEKEKVDFPPARNYFLTFLRDNFTSKVDFAFENPQYQPFTGVPDNSLLNQGFNMQFKVGTLDLMNDYRITGGFRTDFQPVAGLSLSPNSEVMLSLLNHKKRLNKQLNLYRRSQLTTIDNFNVRILNHEAHYKLIWPFNEVQSIQGVAGLRFQRAIALSDNSFSLPVPDVHDTYGILKAMYIHDNARKIDINLYKGTRYKIFTEYYVNTESWKNLHTLGIDFRHYVPLHRTFIFATRFASGTSFGQEKLLHYLGGVDNNVSPDINTETPIAQTENYVFQTVVTNMRGFYQNVRNGNSFAVLTGELRMPLFKYMLNRPIRSEFISSFQIVGFGDLGTAWNGATPWSEENVFNNKIITTGNLQIILNRQSNPIVGGYGVGLRAKVLGYFVRADWAWGVQDGIILEPIFYFSLSTDF